MIKINNITSAKYMSDSMSDENYCINVVDSVGLHSVPINTDNTDYVEIMKLVNSGKVTIEDAD